jgi:hypothetical protein
MSKSGVALRIKVRSQPNSMLPGDFYKAGGDAYGLFHIIGNYSSDVVGRIRIYEALAPETVWMKDPAPCFCFAAF